MNKLKIKNYLKKGVIIFSTTVNCAKILVFFVLLALIFYKCKQIQKSDETRLKEDYTINFRILGLNNKHVYLYKYYGNHTYLIDSVMVDQKGCGKFKLL